jgi:hypothetical protein
MYRFPPSVSYNHTDTSAWKKHKLSMQDVRFSKRFYAGFRFSGI